MDFQKEVIERSYDIPVVVDFWAPWCGPCQYLGPVVESLAEESAGKWELAKVNVDDHQEIASNYGIRGIPDVRMFHKGKAIANFTGALSKPQIIEWLENNLPDERKDELKTLSDKIENEEEGALQQLKKFVENNPDLEEARILLAKTIVFKEPEQSAELIKDIKADHKLYDEAEDVRELARLMNCNGDDKHELSQKIQKAKTALLSNDKEQALENLISAVMIDKNYCEELPRKATIAFFRVLGDQHELTKKFRRKFDMALY